MHQLWSLDALELDCARQIERDVAATFNDPGSPIQVRIGVHIGEVVREADDFFGHAVNHAARVAGAAHGGEALVSSLVHELVSRTGEFTFEPHRSVELTGSDGPSSCTRSAARLDPGALLLSRVQASAAEPRRRVLAADEVRALRSDPR